MTARHSATGRPKPSGAHVAEAALVFATLSNEHRLRLLLLLDEAGPTRVSEISTALGLRAPHASQQVARLSAAGLVRRVGPGTYALQPHPMWSAVRDLVAGGTAGHAG